MSKNLKFLVSLGLSGVLSLSFFTSCNHTENQYEAESTQESFSNEETTASSDVLNSTEESTSSEKAPSQLENVGSKGLTYVANEDGKTCKVTGLGTCKDTQIVIPRAFEGLSVTAIGARAFEDCENLVGVEIPEGITVIEESAFAECSSLKKITIPNSVKTIGNNAFYACGSLQSAVIGNGVTAIGDSAFYSCFALTEIEIPDGVQSIGMNAFRYCSGLKKLVIGNGVETIGDSAFYECTSLTNVEIPDHVTSIGAYAFSQCTELERVNFGKGLESIGNSAFNSCRKLKSVEIMDYYRVSDLSAFRGSSVECLGLLGCNGLSSFTSKMHIDEFSFVADMPCLKELRIDIIKDQPSEYYLTQISQCTRLEILGIPDSFFTFQQFAWLKSKLLCVRKGLDGVYPYGKDFYAVIGKRMPKSLQDPIKAASYQKRYDALVESYRNRETPPRDQDKD